jgi:ABC-type dipeptide/oligopeptide/nickel transport system permease component
MRRYITKRIFYGLISVWLLTIIIFLAIRITGDPARIMAEPGAGEEDLQLLRKEFGLDRPIHFQYYT